MSRQPATKYRRAGKPGKTAFSQLNELVKWVDLIVEVLDARAPVASRHPSSGKLFGNKARLLVLNKADLAEPQALKKWLNYFAEKQGQSAIALTTTGKQGKGDFLKRVLDLTSDKAASQAKKGLLPRPVRLCVVGMPNVGKSSLINWLVGQSRLKVADRPGVTKAPQWLRIHPKVELLDTPGILPNQSLPAKTLIKLSILNLVSEASYDQEESARSCLDLLRDRIKEHLGGDADPSLEALAQKRNFLTVGGKLDTKRAATTLLCDLRDGKLGAIMLDDLPTI
jgi:ribosome biogenesis GTPase A